MSNPIETPRDERAEAVARARRAWAALGSRILSITPAGIVRFALAVGAIYGIFWILARTWSALIPFQIGVVLAYLLLPLVSRLSRRMPRWLAILLTFGIGLLVVVVAVGFIVPPVTGQLSALATTLPEQVDFQGLLGQVEQYYQNLPTELRDMVDESLPQAIDWLRTNIITYLRTTFNFLVGTVLGIVNTATFLLGFLVVPFWLFFVLNDYHAGARAFNRLMPGWMREDVWAVLRITDRVIGRYIRGQLLLGISIAVASYLGLTLLQLFGVGGIQYTLLLALFAGVTELVPLIGPIIGSIPALILAFNHSWQAGLAVLALYVAIQQLENNFLVPRIQGESIEIHPAILSLLLVAMSQFGFIWLILAAPVAAIVRDIFRYIYGRFGEPPAPAGVIPGDEAPAPAEAPAPSAQPAKAK